MKLRRLSGFLLLLLDAVLRDIRRAWREIVHPFDVLDEEMRRQEAWVGP